MPHRGSGFYGEVQMNDDELDDLAVTAISVIAFIFFIAAIGSFVWWAIT
jgi:hypothetical protein